MEKTLYNLNNLNLKVQATPLWINKALEFYKHGLITKSQFYNWIKLQEGYYTKNYFINIILDLIKGFNNID